MSAGIRMVAIEIVVPGNFSGSSEGTLRVLLEDVSEADAPARVVATAMIADARVVPGGRLAATLQLPAHSIDPQRQYNVRVHMSTRDSNAVQSGDLVSTQSVPVLTQGHPSSALVALREVK